MTTPARIQALNALKLVIAIQEHPEQNPTAIVDLDPMAERQVRAAIAAVEAEEKALGDLAEKLMDATVSEEAQTYVKDVWGISIQELVLCPNGKREKSVIEDLRENADSGHRLDQEVILAIDLALNPKPR